MNIISYDIELIRGKKVKEEINKLINSCISNHYTVSLDDRAAVESAWNELPYQELVSIYSPAFLLFSFTIENVQVYLFKKETKKVTSLNELTVTIVAISQKEINLILKSSFSKLASIFSEKLKISVIEGTQANLYPFDFDKNDVLNPSFYVRAEYDTRSIKLETKDWIKLIVFILITGAFVIMYFTAPAEVLDPKTNLKVPNNLKEVFSAVMSIGLTFVIVELITNLLVPKLVKRKYPIVRIKNFSNIFENKGNVIQKETKNPVDPVIN